VDLDALASRLPRAPVTRFAPSPTGLLHLGHVVNAIYVWGLARALGGRVILRIEDHDRARSRPACEAAILEDLEWLGLEPDGQQDGSRSDRLVRQSERTAIYERALDRLRQAGLVYACECSRREILEAGGSGPELRYPGTCATRALPESPNRALRLRLPRSEERFVDLALGEQVQVPADQCGDLLVRDRNGYWTYQFAVTVDDMEQAVTHVIRGADLLTSTGRQLQLARLLGRPAPPSFLHHPLVMKSPEQKVSKSDGDTGIRELRAAGWSPNEVLDEARALVPVGFVR
jgi:glutamyl-tRNA synthetase/glutamyl-Q tRNA(Asp) synthetase